MDNSVNLPIGQSRDAVIDLGIDRRSIANHGLTFWAPSFAIEKIDVSLIDETAQKSRNGPHVNDRQKHIDMPSL